MGAGLEIKGLTELRKALAAADKQWSKELSKANRVVAKGAAAAARAAAAGGTPMQVMAAGTIRPSGTATGARIRINPGSVPYANIAFWGARRHTGWYRQGKYSNGTPQFPKWVGSDWEVAKAGQGPYAINPALAGYVPTIIDDYLRMLDDLFARAFPD